VAVLGYHDVRDRGGSPMLIAGSKFREQMQAIKDSKIPVIPLSRCDGLEEGRKEHPEEVHRHHHGRRLGRRLHLSPIPS
jgi:hypothetical protein